MIAPDFVRWIESEVQARGWSQRELARRAHLSSGAISNFFANGDGGDRLIVRLASALGMDADDLLRRAGLPTAHRRASPADRWRL